METAAVRKLHLISNIKSGRGHGSSLPQEAARLCRERSVDFYNYEIKSARDVETQISRAIHAAEKDEGVVAVAGGDGTVRSVAQRAHAKGLPFAVIPCGTFNYFARTHQIPSDPMEALKVAITGHPRPVRLGQVNGEVFLVNASLGLYAKAIRERELRSHRWGRKRMVALFSTLISLLAGHWTLEVDLLVDNLLQRISTPMIFIGNNALQMRNLSLDIAQCMKKDLLAAVAMKPLSKWEIVKLIFYGLAGRLERAEGLDMFCVASLIIYTRGKGVTVALDGELFRMSSPLHVEALPGALNLMLPLKERSSDDEA